MSDETSSAAFATPNQEPANAIATAAVSFCHMGHLLTVMEVPC
jgi:hypothetical protein